MLGSAPVSVVVHVRKWHLAWRHKCTEAMEMTKDDREKKKEIHYFFSCVCLRNWYLGIHYLLWLSPGVCTPTLAFWKANSVLTIKTSRVLPLRSSVLRV